MHYPVPLTLSALCGLFLLSMIARAEPVDIRAESGSEKVAVLELYTSEGCSSCPPADRFVRNLGRTGWYPQQVIPLSFHVTYWNDIGWRDPFSQDVFDQRQRKIADWQNSRTVYTPQLVLDGQDIRRFGRFGSRVAAINSDKPDAEIALEVQSAKPAELKLGLDVSIEEPGMRRDAAIYIALFENNLVSRVNAGENKGKTLEHDYVVRRLIGPLRMDQAGPTSRFDENLTLPAEIDIANAGIAVLVQNVKDGSGLQALAVSLEPQP